MPEACAIQNLTADARGSGLTADYDAENANCGLTNKEPLLL